MQAFWNQRYAEPGYKYGTEPNAFLREQAVRLPAGAQVLVPGDGEGRNSVWLAAQGHRVLAVDVAEVGLAKARQLALAQGDAVSARLRTQWADLAEWQPPAAQFDAVVLTYVHLPSSFRAQAHQRLAAALKPGGWLILEAFHPQQLGRASGGPKDLDMLVTLTQTRADFHGLLREVTGRETEVQLSEGPGHQGPGYVTRWVGQRPAG
jgi:SAM-dependent methyltransferase